MIDDSLISVDLVVLEKDNEINVFDNIPTYNNLPLSNSGRVLYSDKVQSGEVGYGKKFRLKVSINIRLGYMIKMIIMVKS